MKLTIDLRATEDLVRRRISITSWIRLAHATRHGERQLHDYYRSEKKDGEIDNLFERNRRRQEARRQKRLKREMLIHLARLTWKLGYTPGKLEIRAAGRYSYRLYVLYFGSLREAQRQADLIPNPQGRHGHLDVRSHYTIHFNQNLSPGCIRLIGRIKAVAQKLNRTPTYGELKTEGIYYENFYEYVDRAGEMWKLCGLVPNPRGRGIRKSPLPPDFQTAP